MRILISIFILFAGLLPAAAQLLPQDGVLLDSYAAVVNGKVITVGDIFTVLQPMQAQLTSLYDGPELEEKIAEEYRKTRDHLIESELILMSFEEQGGALPDRAIEDHINTVIHERFNDDRTAFFRALAEERLTFAEWRKQMKEQLIVQVMRQREVSSKILITPFDIQQAYERMKNEEYIRTETVTLRTLAFPAEDPDALDSVREQAAGIRDRALAGDLTFSEAADLTGAIPEEEETFEITALNEDIRAAIQGIGPGGISEPLPLGGSVYLIQVTEREAEGEIPLEEAAPEIERTLRKAEFERLNRIWIDSLRAKYYVQVFTHNLFD